MEIEEELKILRQIANLIKVNQDKLLMEVVEADCKCQGKTKKVFKSTEAFEINMLLSKLSNLKF